ncbi:MAG: hypothetical protein Kow0068_22610 [Marinilabiliales bacterium]
MRIFICFLLLTIFVSACKKKEDNYIITGIVYNAMNSETVPGVNIEVSAQMIENGTWNSQYTNLTSVVSQNDGSYRIELDNVKIASLRFNLTKNNYFNELIDINPENLSNSEENNQDLAVYPMAWIKYHIENQNPYDEQDILKIRVNGITKDDLNCCNEEYEQYTGMSVNVDEICKIPGNQNVTIEYLVTKHSNVTSHSMAVNLVSGDTSEVNILY